MGVTKVHWGLQLCENGGYVDFHDNYMHLLDFEVAQNLDDSAPEKYLESLALLKTKKYQLFN